MKQAEHCGCSSTPTLNQTGELKRHLLPVDEVRELVVERRGVLLRREVAVLRPHAAMVVTTRPTSCRTERSRSGVPSVPRKYFDATTFVASSDQVFGTSTSLCSKMTAPPSPVI